LVAVVNLSENSQFIPHVVVYSASAGTGYAASEENEDLND